MRKLIAIVIGVALAGVGTVALAGRDSSGTMTFNSVAGGYPFQAGVISRTAMNANFAEIISELTDSASRSGKGGFSAPVRGPDGTAAAPAFSFTGDTNTGLYRIGTDNVGISLGGTKKVDLASGLTAFTDPVSFAGSTTVTGVATFNGTEKHAGAAEFDAAVTFAGSVTVPTPGATTDAANKAYADSLVSVATVNATNGTDWTGTVRAAKRSGIVTVTFDGVSATVGSASWGTIATLPAGYRPGAGTIFMGQVTDASAGAKYVCHFYINTSGVLVAADYHPTTAAAVMPAIGTGDIVYGSVTYVAGN